MGMLAIQTFLLMAIAYILGCVLGCLLHQWFGSNTISSDTSGATATAAAAVGGAAAIAAVPAAAEKPQKPAPKPPVEPVEAKPEPVVAKAPKAKAKPKAASKPKTAAAPVAAAALGGALTLDAGDEKAAAADKLGDRPPALKAARDGKADDLKMVKGIGPQNEGRLNALGTYHFDQIASWNKKQCTWVGSYLAFQGRIEREEWVKQAKVLAKGKATEFSKRVASGQVASSSGKTAKVGADFMGKKPRTMKAPRKAGADNLTLIDGVGNALEKRLFELGIYHFDQIAKWTPDNAIWAGNQIGFPGRIERESWIEESKILAAGGTTDHAKKVEEGKIKTSRTSKTKPKK